MKNYLLLSIFFTFLLLSCSNDLQELKKINFSPNDPNERSKNLHIVYTDSGYAKVEIFAKIAETFSKPEQIVKLKDSVEVKFFNEEGEVISILTSLYGEVLEKKGLITVRDSVILRNLEKKQQLESEELHWNQKDSIIFTDKQVVVRTDEALFFGKGLRTRQDFSTYEFIKPEGKIKIKD
ncbi:MAG: LPS export ABC transporter periplasmic protein LptC [Flavobacteriia bacterium]|nr:LPS export ABC transporter periplasmic protein LptC [Flavobacteriia bacterium]